jgi:hypothetical protein
MLERFGQEKWRISRGFRSSNDRTVCVELRSETIAKPKVLALKIQKMGEWHCGRVAFDGQGFMYDEEGLVQDHWSFNGPD